MSKLEMEINNDGGEKFSKLDKISVAFAEFFGTMVLLFVSCLGCVPGIRDQDNLQAALTSGFACLIAIFLFGHISGAHVNPISTICAVIVKKIPLNLAPIYFAAQALGGTVGYGLIVLITPKEFMQNADVDVHGMCTTIPNQRLTIWQAVLVEMILSLILTFANCSSWDYRNKKNQDSTPLKFGFLISALIMSAGPYTGASMNPIKSFAPALWNNDWKNHWIYWVSPISSALFGSFFYSVIFLKKPKKTGQVL